MGQRPEEDFSKESLEGLFAKLEQAIAVLENRETTLEASFQAYEQGMKYLKACHEKIDMVEKRMLVINENGGYDEF